MRDEKRNEPNEVYKKVTTGRPKKGDLGKTFEASGTTTNVFDAFKDIVED